MAQLYSTISVDHQEAARVALLPIRRARTILPWRNWHSTMHRGSSTGVPHCISGSLGGGVDSPTATETRLIKLTSIDITYMFLCTYVTTRQHKLVLDNFKIDDCRVRTLVPTLTFVASTLY